jgi:alkane 1-monooxygenase
MHPVTFLLPYVMPAGFAVASTLGGHAWLIVPAVAFGAIPALDAVIGTDAAIRDEAAPRPGAFDAILALWIPAQLACIVAGVLLAPHLTAVQLVGFALACGIVSGGGGITVAHELCHRKAAWARAGAEVLMASVLYPWFTVEHVLGHHRNVATPVDPATSRLGETVYAFWFRSVFGGLRSAWRLETDRVHKRSIRGVGDRRLRMGIEVLAVLAFAVALGGAWGLLFIALQGFVAVTLLEVINYVEHYGLERQKQPNGRYERVQPWHSWNSNQALTNRFLFNLQRHADHHAFAYRPYDHLRPWLDAPELPMGYPSMVLLALVPPLWRRVMDPRVAALGRAGPASPPAAAK